MDGLKALGLLNESWSFASGNCQFLGETTARYGTPPVVNGVPFAGVILWEDLGAGLFWWAGLAYCGRTERSVVYAAFIASLLLWAGFLLADEVFVAYAVAGTPLWLFIAHLVTLVAVEVLPYE